MILMYNKSWKAPCMNESLSRSKNTCVHVDGSATIPATWLAFILYTLKKAFVLLPSLQVPRTVFLKLWTIDLCINMAWCSCQKYMLLGPTSNPWIQNLWWGMWVRARNLGNFKSVSWVILMHSNIQVPLHQRVVGHSKRKRNSQASTQDIKLNTCIHRL